MTCGTADDARKSLASLRPSRESSTLLRKVISKIAGAQVIDKPRLFIKSSDLVDGVLGLSITDSSATKSTERDVVTKGILPKQKPPIVCLRCSGKSELGISISPANGHGSIRWAAWEKTWIGRCICGGLWSNSS